MARDSVGDLMGGIGRNLIVELLVVVGGGIGMVMAYLSRLYHDCGQQRLTVVIM